MSWIVRAAALVVAGAIVASCAESPTGRRPDGVALSATDCAPFCGGGGGNTAVVTTTTLAAAPATIALGASTLLTATLTVPSGSPTGVVTFYELPTGVDCSTVGTTTSLGAASTVPYTLTVSNLTAGVHTLTACFVSNSPTTYTNSGSSTTVTVGKAVATMNVTTEPTPDSPSSTNFTAIVVAEDPAAGLPTGLVTFYEFIDGQSCDALNDAEALTRGALDNGRVTASARLTAGAHTITACYAGDDTFLPASSSVLLDAGPAASVITLTRDVDAPVTGQSVAFTASVSSDGSPVASGSVTYKRGGTSCTDAVTLLTVETSASAFAPVTVVFKASESPATIRACYEASGAYQNSDASMDVPIGKAQTTTRVTFVGGSTVPYGDLVTLRITSLVAPPGGAIAGLFRDVTGAYDSCESSDPLVSRSSDNASLIVLRTLSSLQVGTSTIVACSRPSDDYGASSARTTLTITKAPLQVIAPPDTSKLMGAAFVAVPRYSGFALNEGPANLSVKPTCTSAGDAPGALPGKYAITCSGGIASNYTFTYTDGSVTVLGSATTVTLATPTVQYSDRVRFSANVAAITPIAGVPLTGKVTFTLDGTVTGVSDVVNGVATLVSTPVLTSGAHIARAVFTSASAAYTSNASPTIPFNATPENASITPASTNVGAINVSQSSVTLGFTVRESSPEPSPNPDPFGLTAAGNINLATLSARLVGVASNTTGNWVSCTGATASGTGYSATRAFSCTFTPPSGTSFPVDAYTVEVAVGGTFYTGTYEDVLAVFDPAAGFVSGGGKFIDPTDGLRVSFGMGFTYTGKGKTGYRGGWVVVKHMTDGGVCRIKSNTMNPPAVTGTTAALSGKSNYACVDALGATTASAGNIDATGYVEDNGTGGTADKFWIGAIGKLNMAKPAKTTAALLSGGNITVPKP